MKKLFALLAVASLAAVGCNDGKTTGKPTDRTTTGGNFVQTNTVRETVTHKITDTVHVNTATDTRVNTVVATTTVPAKKGDGPGLPGGKGKDGDK